VANYFFVNYPLHVVKTKMVLIAQPLQTIVGYLALFDNGAFSATLAMLTFI
jgi:hypothetical protein